MSEEYNQKIVSQKEEKLKLVEEFYREYGRLPKVVEKYKEVAIGVFLNNIKQGSTQMTEEQLKRLVVLGFDINIKDAEEEKIQKIKLIEEFYREYGRLPKVTEKYREVKIGKFLSNIKRGNTKISEEQLKRLEALGFDITTKNREEKKMRKIRLIEEFYKEYGRLPKAAEEYEGEKIGVFLDNIKYGLIQITENQMNRLFKLGFKINVKDAEEEKMRKIKLIEEFYKEYKRLPKTTEKYKEVALGTFLHHIREGDTKISEEQMNRLKKLGFTGQINNIKVEKRIQSIEQFYKETGRIPMPNENLGKKKNRRNVVANTHWKSKNNRKSIFTFATNGRYINKRTSKLFRKTKNISQKIK